MLDPANRVPLESLDLTPEEIRTRKEALLELEHLQADKDRAEDRLLDRLEAAATARQLSAQQTSQAKSQIRTRPLPRGPVRHPGHRR